MDTNNITLGVLVLYGLAIAVRLGISTVRGQGHEWQLWDGGLLLRGKRMGARTTLVVFVVTVALELVAAAYLVRGL